MWTESKVFQEDLEALSSAEIIPWGALSGKTVFITGATGLIGSCLVSALLYYEQKRPTGLSVIALVRDRARAEKVFARQIEDGCKLSFLEGSIESLPPVSNIDYILHCACPTESAYFVSHPVDTLASILSGTRNVLELAKAKEVKGVVYLSSMEVYGEVRERKALSESDMGYLDPLSLRSSYPMGKRAAETMCHAYYGQYGVPVTIARLAQTFGPGVKADDKRVFAYMARCAIQGEDICLNTDGSKENMYLYTADAVSALLLLLVSGERGCAYNVANEDTYCSIREMGELVLKAVGNGGVVKTGVAPGSGIYPPNSYLMLDASRLRQLGWKAVTSLEEMYVRMIGGYPAGKDDTTR